MPVARNLFRPFLLALSAAVVGGCGYSLRGGASLAPDLDALYISGPAGIGEALTQIYEGAGIGIQSTRESARTLLLLSDEQFSQRVLSVDPGTGKERELELAYRVAFRVTDGAGGELVAKQTVSLLRDYVIDTDEVLGKSREQDVLHAEMRRDAAGQILRRIEAALGH